MLAACHEPQTEAGAVEHERNEEQCDKRQQHEPVELKAADVHKECFFLSDILYLRGDIVGVFCGVYGLDDDRCRRNTEQIQRSADDGLVGLEVYTRHRQQRRVHNAGDDRHQNGADDEHERGSTLRHVLHHECAAECADDHYTLKTEVDDTRVFGNAAAESDENEDGCEYQSILNKQ